MADLIINGTGDEAKFVYSKTIDAAGVHTATFNTKNTFVDKNIEVSITTPAAAEPTLDVTDIISDIVMGSASNGVYEPTATIAGNVNVSTAGWITTGNKAVSDTNVKIGKVNQSTLTNGAAPIASGAEIIPETITDQTVTISEGYYGVDRTVVVKSQSAGQAAVVTSGDATINTLTYTYDEDNHEFDVAGSQTIGAPSISTPGYISTTVGTKNTNTATVATSVDEIGIGLDITGTSKVKPVLARTAKGAGGSWVDAASGAGTTTTPSSGAYVQVDAAAVTDTLSAEAKVTSAGYGTTEHYNAAAATNTTIGTVAADSLYIPIAAGTVASGTAEISAVTYTYDADGGQFNVAGSANIPAPTVSAAGYVGNDVGTLNGATNGATVATTVNKIGIAASLSAADATVTPIISKNAATNVDAAAATTVQPASGKYVAVNTAAISDTITASAAVTSAGYGTTTAGQYTDNSVASVTVGAAASDVTYIPITSATFANTPTSQVTYGDISSTAPVLVSGDYLYINKGYTDDVKISLAKLVPDQASADLAADYILSGYAAYNNDGVLIAGSVPTYNGSYTVG